MTLAAAFDPLVAVNDNLITAEQFFGGYGVFAGNIGRHHNIMHSHTDDYIGYTGYGNGYYGQYDGYRGRRSASY